MSIWKAGQYSDKMKMSIRKVGHDMINWRCPLGKEDNEMKMFIWKTGHYITVITDVRPLGKQDDENEDVHVESRILQ